MADYGLTTLDKKYGTGSFYSPNNSTRTKSLLITPTSGDFSIDADQDFIISVWIKYGSINVSTVGAVYPIIQYGGVSSQFWALGVRIQNIGGNNATPYFQYGTTRISATFNGSNGDTIAPDGWSNWLVQRTNGVITFTFTNATNKPNITTATFTGSIGKSQPAGTGMYVGATNPGTISGDQGAYIDELFFARGISSVQRRNPTLGSINDGTLATTVFLYQFDGNYFDDETGLQLFSAALADTGSAMSATLSQVTSLKTAQAALTATTALTGDITSITGTQRFSSTPSSRFSLDVTLTQTYRISPTIGNNTGGYYLDNISLDSITKKFGQQSLKIGGITLDDITPQVLTAGAANEWLALGSDNNGGTIYAWYSSNNGATWTRSIASGLSGATITAPSVINLQYHNGRFVFGYATKIYTSTNSGATWTTFTPNISGEVAVVEKIYYANNLWIIIAGWYGTGASYIYTSTDLNAWTRRTSILNTDFLQNSLQVEGIAASGTTVKITVSCTATTGSVPRYDLYTSTNSTTWTRELNFTGVSQGYLGLVATDGANNWMAHYYIYNASGSTSEVYTKAGAGAWTRKTAGLGVLGYQLFYFNGKWYTYNSGDQRYYSSNNLGTSWSLAFRQSGGLPYQKSSTTLAKLENSSANSADYKFVSAQDVSTWTNSSIANLVNIPETVSYTAGDNRYTTWKTLDFWMYFDPNGQSGQVQWILAQGNGYNPNNEGNWFLFTQMSGTSSFSISDDTGSFASGLSLNAWHHVRVVKDGVNLAYFVDGTRRTIRTLTEDWYANPGPFVIGGNRKANVNIYLDEVLLSKDILTPVASTTYTTPTTAWTSTASANLLLHFDNSLLDDNNLPLAGYLGSFFTMETLAGKNIISDAQLSSTTSIQVTARKVKEIVLDRQAVATLIADATTIKRSNIALNDNFSFAVDEIKFKTTAAAFSVSVSTITDAVRIRDFNTAFDSISSTIIVNARNRAVLADITATSSFTVIGSAICGASVITSTSSNLAALGGQLININSAISASTTLEAAVFRVKLISAGLVSNSTISSMASRTARANTAFDSISSLISVTAKKLTGIADINVTVNLTAFASVTKQSSSALVSALNLATNSGKLVGISADLTTTSNSSVTVLKVKVVSANLISSSTLSTSARVNRQFATGLASGFTLVARPIDIARSRMVTTVNLSCGTNVTRSSAQAAMTTQVLWSYIYDKTLPFNQAQDLWIVPADTRLYVVPASSANWIIEADQRTYIIEPDLREYKITPAATEFTIEG